MKNLASRGILSVEEMNALFENRLHVRLHCGMYRLVQHSSSFSSGCRVFGRKLSYCMTFAFKPEGRRIPLDPLPAWSANRQPRTGKGSLSN